MRSNDHFDSSIAVPENSSAQISCQPVAPEELLLELELDELLEELELLEVLLLDVELLFEEELLLDVDPVLEEELLDAELPLVPIGSVVPGLEPPQAVRVKRAEKNRGRSTVKGLRFSKKITPAKAGVQVLIQMKFSAPGPCRG